MIWLLLPLAAAHDFRAPTLLLQERAGGAVEAQLSLPLSPPTALSWTLEPPCEASAALERRVGRTLRRTRTLDCGPEGLAGRTLEADGALLLRVEPAEGAPRQRLLTAGEGAPADGPAGGSMGAGLALGWRHILEGWDHLLFVAGLAGLLFGRWGVLLGAVTAFTAAHSLSLAAAALGWVRAPAASVEAVIALSLIWLAVELADGEGRGEAPRSLGRRWPALAAGACGLVHGLGFAGALAEQGLPEAGRMATLLGFNLGVEAGQLGVLALAIPIGWGASRLPWKRGLRWVAVRALGGLGVAWALERSWAVVAG